jgi:hypothetical protein
LKHILQNYFKISFSLPLSATTSEIFLILSLLQTCDNNNDELVESARLLAAKSFRWESLNPNHHLIKLPWCFVDNCINPFHFARDNRAVFDESDLDLTPDLVESPKKLAMKLENISLQIPYARNEMIPVNMNSKRWALCMFWEEKFRVGRTFSIARF